MKYSQQEKYALASDLARSAGALALDLFNKHADQSDFVAAKGPQDFVTLADRAVEEVIRSGISDAFPEDGFLGEETGSTLGKQGLWVVDPIDGTTNFMRGLDQWAVSIAYLEGGEILFGIIYAPAPDQFYTARLGLGAQMNGTAISVSDTADISRALIHLGRSERTPLDGHLDRVRAICEKGGEYRRSGAAALGLCDVAAGRTDAFFEAHVNAWDVLAGVLIVTEAGGEISMAPLADYMQNGGAILAANSQIPSLLPKEICL